MGLISWQAGWLLKPAKASVSTEKRHHGGGNHDICPAIWNTIATGLLFCNSCRLEAYQMFAARCVKRNHMGLFTLSPGLNYTV
jgi:hypothetical protein